MTTYTITHSNGSAKTSHDSYSAAVAALRETYGGGVYVERFDDRALCWATEEDSIDDDGARALASIYEIEHIDRCGQ